MTGVVLGTAIALDAVLLVASLPPPEPTRKSLLWVPALAGSTLIALATYLLVHRRRRP